MKIGFKNLTEEDKEFIAQTYRTDISHDEKIEILTRKFGVAGRTIRNWWNKLGIVNKDLRLPRQIRPNLGRELPSGTEIILVTTAQNKSLTNNRVIKNMEAYRDFLINEFNKSCEIVVIPVTYRNPTTPIEGVKSVDNWWAKEIEDYIYYNKLIFGDALIHTSFRVRPTAKMPLTGLELLAGDKHLIIGHPRVHFKTLPRFNGDKLYTMSTTGFCTYKNYSDSKAGDIAENHHIYGFSIIEKSQDNDCYIPRNVKCNVDGEFTDLIFNVKDEVVTVINSSKGFIWGDIHHQEIDKKCYEETVRLVNNLKPDTNVLHDVLDGGSKGLNPHEVKDMYILKKKIREGKDNIKKEVEESLEFLKQLYIDTDGADVKVVYSNHDFFLDRYINDANWKKDLYNSEAYFEYGAIQQNVDIEQHGCIFGYLVNSMDIGGIDYLRPEEKYMIGDYVVSLHGDFGTNGGKASPTSLKKLNCKTVTAHSHSPQITDGNMTVGVTAKLDQYYTRRGLSSWAHAHCVIHDSGKSQLLVMNNDYRISNLI